VPVTLWTVVGIFPACVRHPEKPAKYLAACGAHLCWRCERWSRGEIWANHCVICKQPFEDHVKEL